MKLFSKDVKWGKQSFRSVVFFLISLTLLASNVACEKQTVPPGPPSSGEIVLDQENIELTIGDQTDVRLSLPDGSSFLKKFSFASSAPEIVGVEKGDGYSVKLTARRVGNATITFLSDDKEVELTCEVAVKEVVSDGITRILAIGNSFSEDALETYLHSIATTAGDSIIIGNMFIGGASLELHLSNAQGNNAVYSYRKINKFGSKTTRNNVSIDEVLNEERWDYISFQQASHFSGQFETYQASLPALVEYVKSKVIYSRTKYILHQTWAYAQNSNHDGFANYDRDQMTMYNRIMDASAKAATLMDADLVVPAGTAVQNGRTSFWGDNFTRDGYHLNLDIGRYLAACTWYEAIFGKSVIGNPFNPGSFMLSDKEREMAQHAAHAAVQKPFEITDLVNFKTINVSEFSSPVFLDFAQQVPASGWNGVSSPLAGTSVPFLRDRSGALTSLSLTITERFNNVNMNGELNTTTPFDMPNSVSQNSYYGNPKLEFGGMIVPKSVLKIAGLDPSKTYNFCFFGSRGGTSEGRQTKFISTGQNEVVAYLMTGANRSNIACTDGIRPSADGTILITVTAGESNDNATGFYYLNAMRISKGAE